MLFIRRSVKSRPTRPAQLIASRNPALQVTAVEEEGKDVEDAPIDLLPPVHHTPAVAATICSSQWRRDARVLGSPPCCVLTPPTLVREYLFFVTVRTLSLWVASPRVLSQPLCHVVGSRVAALLLVPPLPGDGIPLTHSPRREVASGAVTRRVPTPRLLGVSTVALFQQSTLLSCGANLSQLPLSSDRSFGLLSCRGYSLAAWVQLTGELKFIRDKCRVKAGLVHQPSTCVFAQQLANSSSFATRAE